MAGVQNCWPQGLYSWFQEPTFLTTSLPTESYCTYYLPSVPAELLNRNLLQWFLGTSQASHCQFRELHEVKDNKKSSIVPNAFATLVSCFFFNISLIKVLHRYAEYTIVELAPDSEVRQLRSVSGTHFLQLCFTYCMRQITTTANSQAPWQPRSNVKFKTSYVQFALQISLTASLVKPDADIR